MAKNQMVIGIAAEIVSEDTGVPAHFHTVSNVNIDYVNKMTFATVSSYYSEKLYENGKAAVGSLNTTLYDIPPRGVDVIDWVCRSLIAPVEEGATDAYGNTITPHALTGGTLVERPVSDNQ